MREGAERERTERRRGSERARRKVGSAGFSTRSSDSLKQKAQYKMNTNIV